MDRNLRQARKIPSTFIDDLRERVDLVALVGEKVSLKKSGHNHMACCPFHKEKSPSFSVNAQKQFYHCFGCGAHGDAIDFVQHTERLSFVEAVTLLAGQCGMSLPEESLAPKDEVRDGLFYTLDEAAKFYSTQLRGAKTAIEYLKQRGITGQVAKLFSIGYAPSAWDACLTHCGATPAGREALSVTGLLVTNDNGKQWDRFRDRIMFPIRDRRGRVIAFGGRVLGDGEPKYLNSPAGPTFNKSQCLYGEYENHLCNTQGPLVVVEGYMDVIALISRGFKSVATMGTALTAEHLERLFKQQDEFILCFDGDAAGQRAASRALECALPIMEDGRSLKFLTLPSDEDPDSYLQRHGVDKFKELIHQAVPLSEFLFAQKLKQIPLDSIDARARFSKELKKEIALLPQGAFKTLMYEALDEMLFKRGRSSGLGSPRNWKYSNNTRWSSQASAPAVDQGPASALWMPEEVLTHLLLHNPEFINTEEISFLMQCSFGKLAPFKTLVQWLRSQSSSTLEQRVEIIGSQVDRRMSVAFLMPPLIDKDAWGLEWKGAFERFNQRRLKEQTAYLLQHVGQGELTPTQKEELQALLKLKGSDTSES